MNEVHIRVEIKRARQSLRSAELLSVAGLFADSVSRSYYAVLHAARAALLFHDVIAESHSAVNRLFGLTLIRPGLLEQKWASVVRTEQNRRIEADYDVSLEWESEHVAILVRDAADFLSRIESYLLEHGIEIQD